MVGKRDSTDSFTVAELFAGVGGFRIGLEKSGWEVTWSNQWEPTTKTQHASDCYERNFDDGIHVCENISIVTKSLLDGSNQYKVPKFDLLVGGFPCQDYSVAKSASQAHGIEGKKGVLWWDIHKLLEKRRPPYFFLENVDRLLKSPSSQRGRDFAVILGSVAELGYAVEWRVINAAEFGFPQKRRRVYIVGVHRSKLKKHEFTGYRWLDTDGVIAKAFPVYKFKTLLDDPDFVIDEDLLHVSNTFGKGLKLSPFANAGVMREGKIWTYRTEAKFKGKLTTLKDVLQPEKSVPDEYFVEPDQLKSWQYLKGAKKEERTHVSGEKYFYAEGAIAFPDKLNDASRTILTGEGGSTPSRFKHIIQASKNRFRRLTPVELERLNGFPDDWTAGMPDGRRAFMMGNALVIGVVQGIGKSLLDFAKSKN